MLMVRNPSSRKGDTGRIISRIVPKMPAVRNRSLLRNSRATPDWDLVIAALIGGTREWSNGVMEYWSGI